MGLHSIPGRKRRSLLLVLWHCGICAGFIQENCTDYLLQFERVFSVPGDVAMLNTTLVSPDVFDFHSVPFNISWYRAGTGRPLGDLTARILARGEALWLFNVTLEDGGEYVSVLRTPSRCYMQATKLEVEPPAGACGRPRAVDQELTKGVHDSLHCPLKNYISKLDSYNVTSTLTWYKGCDLIVDQTDGYIYKSKTELRIKGVELHHQDVYTCTLTFTLGGTAGSVSETIVANVTDIYSLVPQVQEPANSIIKAPLGSKFTKRCLVFVPGVGRPFVDVLWLVKNSFVLGFLPSDRVYTSEQRSWTQDAPRRGMWIERMLTFTELRETDFNVNYTCRAYSFRGMPEASFTLSPAEPDVTAPVVSVLAGFMLLFIFTVIIYYSFKVDIVLWFRRVFPVLYANKDVDGKLYDAYVAYPPPHASGHSRAVEAFALHAMPQVLEKACDYKLFIAGRDCLAGQAVVDSVEENIHASRRLLLLYTASTFTRRRHSSSTCCSNNNNVSKFGHDGDNDGGHGDAAERHCESGAILPPSLEGNDLTDTRQQFECLSAMHRALMERSLKVVLVELEEIPPAQLALFPESVRYLRKKQGAVCLWKNDGPPSKWRTCWSKRRDTKKSATEGRASPTSLSPSSRFWKEIRYHMPVRGKRAIYPERRNLLNL